MKPWAIKARTALALGLPNIIDATAYRYGVKLGLHPVRRLDGATPTGDFFRDLPEAAPTGQTPSTESWGSSALLFGRWPVPIQHAPPDWLADPLSGKRIPQPQRPWWQIPDFDPEVGDIKLFWELSRMDWVLAFAQRAREGDRLAITRLNTWLEDWCRANPPYLGPNWKCGQEASIRVIHLAAAALLLGQMRAPAAALIQLIRLHLRRIAPTLRYAAAQDNNHGTSEAAALFIGGSWLVALGLLEGRHWYLEGRRLLEERTERLIAGDGTFSQYSTNYHRVVLDTLCMAEIWRQSLELPAFSSTFQQRTGAASRWLHHIVDESSGDAPNVGANDGARLLQLGDTAYRDYRPTVQMSMALFTGERAYALESCRGESLGLLGIRIPERAATRFKDFVADDGGFVVLRRGAAMVLLRYPRFRFRPSQADALHLDLWLNGENLLRDAGSFGYNTESNLQAYFPGTASHNTVQFDDRDQMPRLSRFLFGEWLKTSMLEPMQEKHGCASFGAGYRDWLGAEHHRRIYFSPGVLKVQDTVRKFKSKAVLRWRLAPGQWKFERTEEGCRLSRGTDAVVLSVSCPRSAIREVRLVQGWESRHYLEITPLPVVEVEICTATTLDTTMSWKV